MRTTIIFLFIASSLMCSSLRDSYFGITLGQTIEEVGKSVSIISEGLNEYQAIPIRSFPYFGVCYLRVIDGVVDSVCAMSKPAQELLLEEQEKVVRALEIYHNHPREAQPYGHERNNDIRIGNFEDDEVVISIRLEPTFIGKLLLIIYSDVNNGKDRHVRANTKEDIQCISS